MRCCFYNSDLGQQYFTILKYKLFSFNIQDDQSMHGLLAKLLKKFPKSPIRPVSCELWSVWMNINRVYTLQHNKEFIMFIFVYFLFSGFIMMCNLQKGLIHMAFWVLLQAMFMNDWKQMAQQLKLQERLLTIQKRNIIWWNIYRDDNFHSRRQVLKCLYKLKSKIWKQGCLKNRRKLSLWRTILDTRIFDLWMYLNTMTKITWM